MGLYRRILLLASPALQQTSAFHRASWLALTTGASLHVALIDRDATVDVEDFLQQRRQWLDEQANVLRAHRIGVSTQVIWADSPTDMALALIADSEHDLVIRDVERDTPLLPLTLSPLDWQLLHRSQRPVLLVGPAQRPVPKIVIAAVDVSVSGDQQLNQQVVRQACELADACDAVLHLFYGFLVPSGIADDFGGSLFAALMRNDREALEVLAQQFRLPAAQVHFRAGPAVSGLSELAADLAADVLVLGVDAGGDASQPAQLGSTVRALMHRAPCDVLAVKRLDGRSSGLSAAR